MSNFNCLVDKNKALKTIEALVQKYQSNRSFYESGAYNETELRVEFLNPLFQALGWDVNNEQGLPSFSREVIHEASVLVEEEGGEKSKKPDYLFQLGHKKCFFMEAKKPSVDVLKAEDPSFQLRRYGWSGSFGISILSNFKDLVIYDCSVRPMRGDAPTIARIVTFHFTEYVDRFDELYQWASKDSALNGTFDELITAIDSVFQHEPFDSYFLEQIRSWRLILSTDLVKKKTFASDEDLNSYVQRLLNRILFLRICEDRELERYEELKRIATSAQLLQLFQKADQKYDSGLFELLLKNEPMPSPEVLLKVLGDLYYPNSSYDFNVVDTYVISQIYDLFLCEEMHIEGDFVSVRLKPDLAETEGAVCTPKSISDCIVDRVVDDLLCADRTRWPNSIKLADICCGSGVFLVSAFEKLCNKQIEYLSRNLDESLSKGLLVFSENGPVLSFESKRGILTECIYGVDIDPAAVEVCRFNLQVKLLESVSTEEVDEYRRNHDSSILPNIDNHILVGNSLIDNSFYDFMPEALSNLALIQKIKPFEWKDELKDGFDAIVGNPPYIRVQNIVQNSPEEYAYMRSDYAKYATAKVGLADKYQWFVERSLNLIHDNGVVGLIVPNKFLTLKSGEALRTMLAGGKHVSEIVNFGSLQVFSGRMTYTCIVILSKAATSHFDYTSVEDLNTFFLKGAKPIKRETDELTGEPWTFENKNADKIIEELGSKISPLKELANVFVGLQTSADDIYTLTPTSKQNGLVTFTDIEGKRRSIEEGILRPLIYKVTLHKHAPVEPNKFLIFPYQRDGNKTVLLDKATLQEKYPLAYDYLSNYKDRLDKRNCVPAQTEETWFRFGRSQSLKKFDANALHIVWSTLSLDSKYVVADGTVCFTGGGNGPYYGLEMKTESPESIYYLLSLLNHPFIESFIRRKSSYFAGGYYSHGKQFVEGLPIRRINFDDASEKNTHDEIVSLTESMRLLGKQLDDSVATDQKAIIQRAIDENERRVNSLIDQLYGLKDRELI